MGIWRQSWLDFVHSGEPALPDFDPEFASEPAAAAVFILERGS